MISRAILLLFTVRYVFCMNSPYEALKRVSPEELLVSIKDVDSTKCALDVEKLLNDLSDGEFYALQLVDAWAKVPDGLLIGNHYFFGQFEECHSVVATNNSFVGKYCLLDMDFPELHLTPLFPDMSVFSYGICVPSSCSPDELNKAFSKYNETISLQATELKCSSNEDELVFELGDCFVLALLALLVFLAMASTIYEVWQIFHLKNDKPHPLLASFSVYRNGRAIFEVKTFPGQMECLNGIRAITMCWVLLCHYADSYRDGPTYNVFEAMQAITKPLYVVMSNGFLSVDTFFLLSGLLVAFVFLRDVSKTGSYDVPRSYVSRFIRITPPYAMMILLQVTLIKYMGDGPLWDNYMYKMESICRDKWWTGLLYVQNIVNPHGMCLIQTWYLSADMQLYWIAPLILYPFLFWPKFGGILAAFLTVAAAFLNFGMAFAYEIPFSPIFDQTGKADVYDNYQSWTRASPWLAGICLGYLIAGVKAKKINLRLSTGWIIIGWCISTALCCSCLFGMIWFLDNPDHTPAQAAAFLAFHRLGWALGVGWIIFACIFGYGGPVNTFLSWGLFHPLAKLSFSAYLIHVTVLNMMLGSSRVLLYANLATLTFAIIAAIVIVNFAAIPMMLLVELPVSVFERYFFRDVKLLPLPKREPSNRSEDNKKHAP